MAAEPKITPVPSNAPLFAHEFTKRMRSRKDITKKPSIRQTQSIPQLLSARYFRNGKLTLEDFLEAAVFTTFPPDQDIAREIAEDILLGREKVERPQLIDKERAVAAQAATKKQSDALEKVMEQIRREQELAKVIKKDKVQAGYDYLQELHRNGDQQLYEAATDYLTDGDIVLRGITSDEELMEIAGGQLLDRAGVLTSNDIQNSQTLEVLDAVCDLSNAAEQVAAKSLRGDSDVEQEFSDLAKRDTSTAARALRHIEEMETLDQTTRESLDQTLQDNLKDLSEVADYAAEMKTIGQKYPNSGYGIAFFNWLFNPESRPYNSWGNGSAMRVSPVGLAHGSIEALLEEAEKSIYPVRRRFLLWTYDGLHIMWGVYGNGRFVGTDNLGKRCWGIYGRGVFAGFYDGEFFCGKYYNGAWKAEYLFGLEYSRGEYVLFPQLIITNEAEP